MNSTHHKLFQIHPLDNVAVALDGPLQGHKFALRPICKGENVIKYGMPIGIATQDIPEGGHVHTHNLKTRLNENGAYEYHPEQAPACPSSTRQGDTFSGYLRPDGNAGIRNDIWIIPTVGCINQLARSLAFRFNREFHDDTMQALALTHPYGCSQLGEDHEKTAQILADFCRHPNAGGVLVVALGCENNTLESFRKRLGDLSGLNIRFLRAQDPGDEMQKAWTLICELREHALKQKRINIPVSKLKVGLKCGGSDGFSGITANPLTGRFSDMLTAQGGTTVLTEVPEMFGAETLLMNRCENENIFRKCVRMVQDFKDYFTRHGQTVYENPSPGNKDGGISTLEDKSLGCVQKGGLSRVVNVCDYAERIQSSPGLNLLSGPGNDMVAATALAAAGCQLILFTTGRGTPFGTVVPTLKISTNTRLQQEKNTWIDFDAGKILAGTPPEELADELFDLVLRICSGQKAKNEIYGYQEIAIFKNGVTL